MLHIPSWRKAGRLGLLSRAFGRLNANGVYYRVVFCESPPSNGEWGSSTCTHLEATGAKPCCMCCEKIYMLLVSFLGFLFSLIGLILFLVTVILCQVCIIEHLAYNNKPWVEQNLKKQSEDAVKY